MAHHHQEMKLDFLEDMTNLFLVRNPHQLIASFAQVIDSPTMQDIGLEKSWELFNIIKKQNPVVLDSAEILKNPRELLKKLCDKLRIEFYEDVKNLKQITCFSNEGNKWRNSEIYFNKNRTLEIKISEKFLGERGRINCSLKEKDGFWRWLGIQFVVAEK